MTDELTSNEDVIRAGYDDRAELYAIDAAAAPSTDERLCARCGEVHEDYPMPEAPPYDWPFPAAPRPPHRGGRGMTDERLCAHMIWDDSCGEHEAAAIHHDRARWNYHPFKAAPSTDEGEARWVRDKVVGKYAIWKYNSAEHWVHLSLEATIRAPLEESRQRLTDAFCEVWLREVGRADAAEERIRELEAELNGTVETYMETTGDMGAEVLEIRAENERLREALRDTAIYVIPAEIFRGPYWKCRLCGDHASYEGGIPHRAGCALATPPSSTEGTE